jgi:DNA-binding GntR family transcriptional regulator
MSQTNLNTKGISKDERNLTYWVYSKIKEMMLHYQIIPGQRLVFIELAQRLGVSRTPVNNALSILANEGFLDFVPDQGYRVHEITLDEAESLYEIREMMELGAIGKAIRKSTLEKLEKLERQKTEYEKAVVQRVSRGRFTLDQEFHASIIKMSENLYLADYFREIFQRTFLRHSIEGFRSGRAQEVVLEHNKIFQAIKLKDVERAKDLIKSHIHRGKEYIFSTIFK